MFVELFEVTSQSRNAYGKLLVHLDAMFQHNYNEKG
jgi:hypothetical protein